ncbi:MAG: flagellar hook assembly protein FlgD [Burkholderiales bacterium]|nr:flagellar hook assembly protein FlgD [Burkholderiales bacterium]MCW5621820.1 flagellar hook assembly protein FlgD [Burkholderiales bacterium]
MSTVDPTATESLLNSFGASSRTRSTAENQQDRFLKLLVTQMRNQDPLNPMENAEVTTQIAQISTVNGIDKLNATLQNMEASFLAAQTLQAGSLIGRGVLGAGDSLLLEQGLANAAFVLDTPADGVEVKIFKPDGALVRSVLLGPQSAGTTSITWDGQSDTEEQLADGKYVFEVTATRAGKQTAVDTLGFGRVYGVVLDAQGLMLDTYGLGMMPLGQIKQILP